jgi:hypothetical protein
LTASPLPNYPVRRASPGLPLSVDWDGPGWAPAQTLELACFRPEGSPHRPRTRARLLYDDERLFGIFRVEDRYVRSRHTRYGDPVYRDSCVEIFLEPRPGQGYLNFECNAGGTLLASHVRDPERTAAGFRDFAPLSAAEARRVAVASSLPPVVDPEVAAPLTWTLAFALPLGLLEARVGPLGPLAGQVWRANLYKCGDDTSHPHWASWSPLTERNFHLPACFGTLRFEA